MHDHDPQGRRRNPWAPKRPPDDRPSAWVVFAPLLGGLIWAGLVLLALRVLR